MRAAPASAPAHIWLGLALLSSGQGGEAASELRRALALDGSRKEAHLALGVIEHDRGNTAEALAQWEVALVLDPGSVQALDWIAKTRIEARQFAAAIDLLRTAPEAEDLQVDRVVAYSMASFFEEAVNFGTKEVALHPDWLRLRMAVATILVQRNRYQEAVALLEPAVQANQDNYDIQLLYLRVLVLNGDLEAAKPFAAEFTKKHPNTFDGLYLRGLLERKDGDLEQALKDLSAAAELEPAHYDVRYNLGVTLAKLQRPAEAKSQLQRAEKIDGSSPDVHFQLARVLRASGEAVAAKQQMDLYEEKLRSRAVHDQVVSLAAQAAQRLAAGDAAAAAEAEKEILKLSPDDAVHCYDLALALDQLGDLAAERAALERAVAAQPDFAVAYNQLGYLAIRAGDDTAAERFFRRAIASAPQYAEAESNLGSLLAKQGKDVEAEGHFRTAVAANPRYTDAWINLAASLASRSEFAEARSAAERALKIEPANADAATLLAMLPGGNPVQRP
ncbi:MAG TPA: tetratricopeptide repeat protein [Acidobacteriaceae bacterium]